MTYAVILQYPGDGQLEESRAEFFTSLDDAVAWRDRQKENWLKVFRVEEISESAHWDWGITVPDSDKDPLVYVSESAARNSLSGCWVLVKRRRGTSTWVSGDAA
ncbi:hypothetical protein AB0F72_09420 [Actinoplanes sp. NPDC023936]|uniref:hypothetical protein n=1 Tax=Actinoplanes sp. NPDC023936 TaxID=3154910 RepID=UPI0033EA5D9D